MYLPSQNININDPPEGKFGYETPSQDIEAMVLAQHYGMPTRLLDFSLNPLVALFFAIEGKEKSEGRSVVWCFFSENPIYRKTHSNNPQRLVDYYESIGFRNVPSMVYPQEIDRRIVNQLSIFVYFLVSNEPLNENRELINAYKSYQKHMKTNSIIKILVEENCQERILISLDRIGINRRNLFPDLSGFSCYWRDRYYRGQINQYPYLNPSPQDSTKSEK